MWKNAIKQRQAFDQVEKKSLPKSLLNDMLTWKFETWYADERLLLLCCLLFNAVAVLHHLDVSVSLNNV